jgi:broad specificity phosphatase PhoE
MKKILVLLIIMLSWGVFGENTKNTTGGKNNTVTIYFARHGKTLFNTFDRVQGWADSPLTEPGIEVAKYLGEGLKNIKFSGYYSSDAGRQRETMEVILAQMGIKDYKLIEKKGLREVFYGGFEGDFNSAAKEAAARGMGMSTDEYLKNADKISISRVVDAISKEDPKGLAENYLQVKERTQKALKEIAEETAANGGGNVLVISSGMSIQVMISDMTDNPAKNKGLSNAAVVKITYKNGKFTVDEIGSMKYVEEGKKILR